MSTKAGSSRSRERLWQKRGDTRRWRRRTLGEKQKLLGEKNSGKVGGWGKSAASRSQRKILERKNILLELSEIQKEPVRELNQILVPGFIPGQGFSTDWLPQEWRRWN